MISKEQEQILSIQDLGKNVVKDNSYKSLDNKTIFLKDDKICNLRGFKGEQLVQRIRNVRNNNINGYYG